MDKEKSYVQSIAESLDGVQPELLDEPAAYKRAIIRMAILEYMNIQDEMIRDALERHG